MPSKDKGETGSRVQCEVSFFVTVVGWKRRTAKGWYGVSEGGIWRGVVVVRLRSTPVPSFKDVIKLFSIRSGNFIPSFLSSAIFSERFVNLMENTVDSILEWEYFEFKINECIEGLSRRNRSFKVYES